MSCTLYDAKVAKVYYNRGNAKAELGQYAAAIADYDAAIRLKPDDADAYYNRASQRVIWVNTKQQSLTMMKLSG